MPENDKYMMRRVPRDLNGRLELLTVRPRLWEFLLFGNVLFTARAAHEERWRDYQMGYTLKVGPVVPKDRIPEVFSERFSHVSAITQNLERIITPEAQAKAFGEDVGNATLIEHMASRLIDLYGLLLGWAEETRALRVPDWAENLKSLALGHVDQPVRRTHEFVDEFISKLERAIDHVAEGISENETISINLTYEIDDKLIDDFYRELRRVERHLR